MDYEDESDPSETIAEESNQVEESNTYYQEEQTSEQHYIDVSASDSNIIEIINESSPGKQITVLPIA